VAGEVLEGVGDEDRTIGKFVPLRPRLLEKTYRAGEKNKMDQNNSRLVCLVLFILILTTAFGCSSNKAFKSGITYTCDGGKSFVVELYEQVDIAFLTFSQKRFCLHRMPSGSGTKYSDGNVTLWIIEQRAFVEIDGQTEFKNCSVKPK
jgi:membrane-bound inhibitor of C-type lysozyme